MEELNKNNKSSEEIEEFIPEEADFITDDNIDLTPKKERKIIKKKMIKFMQKVKGNVNTKELFEIKKEK